MEGRRRTVLRWNRALIAVGTIVLIVITTLLLLLVGQIQANRQLTREIRGQARLNACLSLKIAQRHGVDVSGLDSPSCIVQKNGEVIFPGADPGSVLNPGPAPVKTPAPKERVDSPKAPSPNQPPQPPPQPKEKPNPPNPPNPQPDPQPNPSPSPSPTSPVCVDLPIIGRRCV